MHMEICGLLSGLIPVFAVHGTQMVCGGIVHPPLPHFVIIVSPLLHAFLFPLPSNNAYFSFEKDFFTWLWASYFTKLLLLTTS